MKTQITDWLFVYNPIRKVIDENLNIKLKIFYFSLEMSKEQKMLSAFSNILYLKEGIRVAPSDLRSTKSSKILSPEILKKIEEYKPYFEKIEELVTFIDNIRNPFGIYKILREYAQANGTQHKKEIEITDPKTGKTQKIEIDDYYQPNNPDEYVMIIIDHVGLITPENNTSLHQAITKLSSDYLILLRNKYNYIPVVIQQQAASQESLEHAKANKLKPTLNGLGDCKLTQRDADLIMGLFSPFRHELPEYMGYDIKAFRDHIRFLEILGGRSGGGGTVAPLFFDGAVNFFKELPKPDDITNMQKVYTSLKQINN